MIFALLFFSELLFLFFLSRSLSRALSRLFFTITKNHKMTVRFLAILFFPGTVIHELSHAIMAHLLFVRVHHMEFIPKIDGSTVKLGSVAIEKSNVIKSLLIGMAPFFFGTLILLGSFYLGAQYRLFDNYFFILFMLYLAFVIGNTMFSSKKDMEGALELFIALIIIVALLYFTGFRIPSINIEAFFQISLISTAFQKGSFFILVPIIIDAITILLIRILIDKRL